MFEEFFGFERTPFGKDVPVHQLFLSQQYEEAIARMRYVAQNRYFGLLTGEVGSGKSSALRHLRSKLDPARFECLYLADSGLTPHSFYQELGIQLGMRPPYQRSAAKRLVHEALMERYEVHGKIPVVIVDEAHLLSPTMLEEVRFVTNFEMDSFSPMALILSGQPELRRILRLQAFAAIDQRIQVRFHLGGLTHEETKGYIAHHLRVAGVGHPVFTDEAIGLIHKFTAGIARRINNLCTTCLLAAYSKGTKLVDDELVKQVAVGEFDLGE